MTKVKHGLWLHGRHFSEDICNFLGQSEFLISTEMIYSTYSRVASTCIHIYIYRVSNKCIVLFYSL